MEKELLAIVYRCEKFNQYIYGREIIIQTDHKSLEAIMKKSLTDTPPRIQCLLIIMQKYKFRVKYIPGKDLIIADTLSRAPHLPKQNIYSTDDTKIMRYQNRNVKNLPEIQSNTNVQFLKLMSTIF